jgi:hypothetical protein
MSIIGPGQTLNPDLQLVDPVIAERREQIREQRMASKTQIAPLQAECAVMGHVRFGDKPDCFYCGMHWE